MKSDFHFHFYSRLVIMAVLAVTLIFIQKSVTSTAQINSYPYEVNGWAWAASAGWLSLNCYNDFVDPGVYISRCAAQGYEDYALTVDTSGNVGGCIWAGNNLSGGGNPLGWVCFSGQSATGGPTADVATSTSYLNALDTTTFASIINQENWKCAGGVNIGLDCLKLNEAIDCPASTCNFTDDGAWQLGFPISSPALGADSPSAGNPIEGCFNCYEEYDYVCSIDGNPCTNDSQCPVVGVPPDEQTQTCSVITAINYNCENCLDYDYYLGKCDDGLGGGSGTQCKTTDDCTVAGETCQSAISLCSVSGVDCTFSGTCAGGAGNICLPIEVGTLKKVVGAYDCSQCNIESYDNTCDSNSYQGNLNSCDSCTSAWYSPGVMIDHQYYNLDSAGGDRANLCGWGWNAWTEVALGPVYGLGWFQFSPRIVTSTRPYLSVEGGNIYSGGNITGRYLPPFGHYNASYLIESGGSITNFISSSTLAGIYQGEFAYRPTIDFFSFDSNLKYSNALGSIDYIGLIAGKYGSQVNTGQTIANINTIFGSPLGDEVYVFPADLDIVVGGGGLTVKIGTGVKPLAAGTIIVEGDLTISRNITYETGTYTNLKNIPSLVWIVKGDLLIDPLVTDLAGTFIVLGDGVVASCDPAAPVAGCGQIITCNSGNPSDCDNNSLTITGNVLARYFNLNRTYINTTTGEPSERFINDGRIQANPPSGFEDFSNIIPRFSEN